MMAPDWNAHTKALSTPPRASRAVRALAYVAIFMPMNPATVEVTAPRMKATVVKMAFVIASLP